MATYYVRPVNGSDANDGLSFANAKATTAAAIALATTAGDVIRLCVEGTETVTSSIVLGTAGTDTNPIVLEAASAVDGTPLEDGTRYTLSGTNGTIDILQSSAGHNRLKFLRVTNGLQGLDMGNTTNTAVMFGCRFDNNTDSGVYGAGGSCSVVADNCEFDNNGQWGLSQSTSTRLQVRLVNCRIYGNGSGGINSGQIGTISNCFIYDNDGPGIDSDGSQDVINCVIHGNSGHGIYLADDDTRTIFNCSITDNGGYGIQFDNASFSIRANYNLFNGNTSGDMNGEIADYHNTHGQTGDPLYTSTTVGAEDFTPQAGSPLIGNGAAGGMIGAIAHAEGGGGGSGAGLWTPGSGRFGVREC